MSRKETGQQGELLAQNYLKKHGYHIIETNYRCPFGEIDIIGQQKDYLVFIEVRTKKSHKFGSPEESITAAKAEHLRACAYQYIQDHPEINTSWRIDFVAIELDIDSKPSRINLIENAIGEE